MNNINSTSEYEDINIYIDRCNVDFTHYDIAMIVHKVFKHMYRFIGNKQWEYFDLKDKTWIIDDKNKKLKFDIKTIICDLFTTRSLYWFEQSTQYNDINSDIFAKIMSDKMLKISDKLKDDKYISVVIKEAACFFDIYKYD